MDNKSFYVKVHCYHPYKIEFEKTVKASTAGTAVRRAMDEFRKQPKIKGKKIVEFFAQVRSL